MTHLTGALAPAITEPPSKCQELKLICDSAAIAYQADLALQQALFSIQVDRSLEADRRLEQAEALSAAAHHALLQAVRLAQDSGLMAELQGYLTATYGG